MVFPMPHRLNHYLLHSHFVDDQKVVYSHSFIYHVDIHSFIYHVDIHSFIKHNLFYLHLFIVSHELKHELLQYPIRDRYRHL
jgi:hypothetical protein